MKLKTSDNRNISVSSVNGYSFEKVIKAQGYLKEIGSNRRNFPFDKLVRYYNDILGTHDSENGCKCQAPKYYNGIQNYVKFGKLTLINNGLASESDFEIEKVVEPIENAENRIVLGGVSEASDEVSEEVKEDVKEEVKEEVVEEKKKSGRPKKNKE